MFTHEDLQDLLSFHTGSSNVVSLYLDTDTSRQPSDALKLQARALLKEVRPAREAEADTIETYLDHGYDWSRPGLAIFCCNDEDYFRTFAVAIPFRSRVRVGNRPYTKPLAHLLDYYAHYGVILVDRVGAKFFEYHLGELRDSDGVMGEDVRKLKAGRGSSAVGMRGGQGGSRHEEEVVQRNLRLVTEAANAFFSGRPIRRLFIGGTAERVAQLRELLPKQWQSYMAGTFAIDMNAGEHEVRQRTLALLKQTNEEREKRLVEQMITAHAKGGNAVVGLDDALQAICDKRVDTLVISDGYRAPGYCHDESGYVVANLTRSPLSEQELTPLEDVVDAAFAFTVAQGGHVEVISENQELEKAGSIGAILRY